MPLPLNDAVANNDFTEKNTRIKCLQWCSYNKDDTEIQEVIHDNDKDLHLVTDSKTVIDDAPKLAESCKTNKVTHRNKSSCTIFSVTKHKESNVDDIKHVDAAENHTFNQVGIKLIDRRQNKSAEPTEHTTLVNSAPRNSQANFLELRKQKLHENKCPAHNNGWRISDSQLVRCIKKYVLYSTFLHEFANCSALEENTAYAQGPVPVSVKLSSEFHAHCD